MSDRDTEPKDLAAAPEESGFLRRWSQRKHAIARGETPVEPAPVVAPPAPPAVEEPPLPDPTTLTLADDFSVFLRDKVPPALKRKAMQHLFSHPEFNEVDMLDVYMEDFNLVPDLGKEEFALVKHAKAVLDPTPREAVAEPETDSTAPVDDVEPAEPSADTESQAGAVDVDGPAPDPSRESTG
jgi:hypothetical protein